MNRQKDLHHNWTSTSRWKGRVSGNHNFVWSSISFSKKGVFLASVRSEISKRIVCQCFTARAPMQEWVILWLYRSHWVTLYPLVLLSLSISISCLPLSFCAFLSLSISQPVFRSIQTLNTNRFPKGPPESTSDLHIMTTLHVHRLLVGFFLLLMRAGNVYRALCGKNVFQSGIFLNDCVHLGHGEFGLIEVMLPRMMISLDYQPSG